MSEEKTEVKKCSKCKVLQPMNRYVEGRTQCNVCLEIKRKYREKHRQELRDKQKEYYSQNKAERAEYGKQYRQQYIECAVCKVMIKQFRKTEHERTKTHIHNLNNPDNPKLTYKQIHDKKQKDKEDNENKERIRHQQTIEYLNENFPSYPEEP